MDHGSPRRRYCGIRTSTLRGQRCEISDNTTLLEYELYRTAVRSCPGELDSGVGRWVDVRLITVGVVDRAWRDEARPSQPDLKQLAIRAHLRRRVGDRDGTGRWPRRWPPQPTQVRRERSRRSRLAETSYRRGRGGRFVFVFVGFGFGVSVAVSVRLRMSCRMNRGVSGISNSILSEHASWSRSLGALSKRRTKDKRRKDAKWG